MDICNKAGITKPERDQWGELNQQIAAITSRFMQLDKHKIVSVGESIKVDEAGRKTFSLNMRGSYRDFLEGEFDFVLWMQREEKPRGGADYFTTGQCMQGRSGKMRGIELPAKMETPTFDMIYKTIEKKLKETKETSIM